MIARFNFVRFLIAVATVGALFGASLVAADDGSRSPPGTPPTALTREKVWQAVTADLRLRGLAETKFPQLADIHLPGALPSLTNRSLKVTSACWEELPQRFQFRVECGEPEQCLPFLVYLRNDAGEPARDNINLDADGRFETCQPNTRSHKISAAQSPTPSPSPAIRPGDKATAVFVSDNFRMTSSVTCLDRGREGEIIRVRSQNGQVFRARISGPGLLAALP